jgi:hypothetical protein
MRRFAIATTLILLLSGCIKAVDSEDKFRYNLVVDGRIEQGRGATVMLSQSMPYREEYDEEAFREVVIKWAKVTIIHNDREEVLVGRRVEDYPTGYIYSGSDILGEVGESYTLRVEYSKRVWEATTTIVEPIELHDIEIIAIDEDNYTIEATLPATHHPCSIDCAIGDSQYYAPTLLGSYAPSDTPRRIVINRPMENLIRDDHDIHFHPGEVVRLRVNALTEFAYDYWRKWEDNFLNSVNPIFPSTSNLPTNMSNGGLGIWAGYGTSYHRVTVGNQ